MRQRDAHAGSAAAAAAAGTAGPGTAGTLGAQHPGGHGGGTGPRRARDPWKVAFFAVMIVAILAAAAWALLGSSLLTVRSVRVSGTRLVPEAAVLRAAAIRPRIPLIRIDTAQVARQVEQLTEVQSAQVSRDWPNTVVISVRERTPALAIAQQGSFELVDEFGVVVRSTASRPWRVPLLQSPPAGSLRGSAQVRAAVVVLDELPAPLRGRVTAVNVPAADQVTLDLRGGVTVVWGGTDKPGAKAAELTILMRTHASYYDVSDPGTAVTGG
jgi:cell division protein FtsQ